MVIIRIKLNPFCGGHFGSKDQFLVAHHYCQVLHLLPIAHCTAWDWMDRDICQFFNLTFKHQPRGNDETGITINLTLTLPGRVQWRWEQRVRTSLPHPKLGNWVHYNDERHFPIGVNYYRGNLWCGGSLFVAQLNDARLTGWRTKRGPKWLRNEDNWISLTPPPLYILREVRKCPVISQPDDDDQHEGIFLWEWSRCSRHKLLCFNGA